MADFSQEIAALRLFNEKAQKLANSRFLQSLLNGESGWKLSWSKGTEPQSERYGPDQEAIDAFLLTYRFFIQDREPCSLRKMAALYPLLPIDAKLAEAFAQARGEIKRLLDGPPSFPVTVKNDMAEKQYSNGEIIDTFMNGDLAHANNEKARARLNSWRSIPMLFSMMESNLVNAFGSVAMGILYISGINAKALEQLLAQQAVPTDLRTF
jgi:hypothetical protein